MESYNYWIRPKKDLARKERKINNGGGKLIASETNKKGKNKTKKNLKYSKIKSDRGRKEKRRDGKKYWS